MKKKKKPKINKKPIKKAKTQYLFRSDRVEAKKREGWKIIGEVENRKHPGLKDLVLMEK